MIQQSSTMRLEVLRFHPSRQHVESCDWHSTCWLWAALGPLVRNLC